MTKGETSRASVQTGIHQTRHSLLPVPISLTLLASFPMPAMFCLFRCKDAAHLTADRDAGAL